MVTLDGDNKTVNLQEDGKGNSPDLSFNMPGELRAPSKRVATVIVDDEIKVGLTF